MANGSLAPSEEKELCKQLLGLFLLGGGSCEGLLDNQGFGGRKQKIA